MKPFLFIPFLALLGTSCGAGRITTTPVVNAQQAQAFTPTRKYLANETAQTWLNPENNQFTFNWSLDFPEVNQSKIINLKTGEVLNSIPNSTTATEPTASINMFWRNNERRVNFWGIWNKYNGTVSLSKVGTTEAPEDDYTYLYYHLTDFDHPNLTPASATGNYFVLDQSILNISGTFTFDPHISYAYETGYDEGHDMGYETGYNDGRADEHQTAFEEGYAEGIIEGQIEAGNNNAVNLYGLYASLYWLPSHTTATAFFKQYEGYDLFPQVHLTFDPVNIDGLGLSNTPYSNAKQVRLGFVQNFDNLNNLNITWYKNDRVYTIGNFNRGQIAEGYFTTESRIKTFDTQTFEFKYESTDINDYHDFTLRPYQQVFNLGGMFNTMMKLSRIEIGNLWDTEGTPLPQSLYDKYTQDLMRSLIGGTGYSYAQGFQDGTNKAVSSQNAYKNIFQIFTPAFTAVAHFFDMSIGPFKMWYFFAIPLMITALVLFIKLVKH